MGETMAVFGRNRPFSRSGLFQRWHTFLWFRIANHVNMKQKIPHSTDKINPKDADELHYWSRRFTIPMEELKDIMQDLGTSVRAMEAYLHLFRRGLIKK